MFHAISLQTAGNITVTKNTSIFHDERKSVSLQYLRGTKYKVFSLLIDLPSLIVLAQTTDQKTFNIISHFNEHS